MAGSLRTHPQRFPHSVTPARPRTDIWRPFVDLAPNLLGNARGEPNQDAAKRLNAWVAHLPPGRIDMCDFAPTPEGWLGLLILDGLFLVELEAGRAHTGWLAGRDDLIRPWDSMDGGLTAGARWRVLAPARVAVLDRDFARRAAGSASVVRELLGRQARTTTWLFAKSLVMSFPTVEERLLMFFALLGERWGRMTRDGAIIELPFTHGILATLCGTRRPSVTLALQALAADGVMTRPTHHSWLLRRAPTWQRPSRPSCWNEYTKMLGFPDS